MFFDLELVLICDKMYPKREEFNMKKIVSIAVLAALTATVADAAPSYIVRNSDGGYNVTYNYTDKAKTGWYVGARAELSFLNFENEAKVVELNESLNDDYSFEPIFGGNAFVGYTFNHFWRGEIEGGVLGVFEDETEGITMKMTVPYLMANGYYDFTNGLYVGAGLGIALPKTELNGKDFVSGDATNMTASPILGVMLGYAYDLDYNLTLDVRYRLSGFVGNDLKRGYLHDNNGLIEEYQIKNEIGFVLDNSVSIGLRYNF